MLHALVLALATASSPALAQDGPSAKSPEERYDAQYLRPNEFYETPNVRRVDPGLVGLNAWVVPMQGVHGKRLTWPAFYERVGREDLAQSFKRRNTRSWALTGTGIALVGAGAGLLGWSASPGFGCTHLSGSARAACFNSGTGRIDPRAMPAISATVMGVGAIMTITAIFLPLHKSKAHQVRRMMLDHNEALKDELGVEPTHDGGGRPTYVQVTPRLGAATGMDVALWW